MTDNPRNWEEYKAIIEMYSKLSEQVGALHEKVNQIQKDFETLEKNEIFIHNRVTALETHKSQNDEKWKTYATFFIQLAWVIIAAYLLTKLNLQSPAIPMP